MLKTKKRDKNKILRENYQKKDRDISYLKNHNQKLLVQINESKDKKQRDQKLEQDNHDIIKKLIEKDEDNFHLKNHNQSLVEQIKKLKNEKKLSKKI